jgi:hypothetical protein
MIVLFLALIISSKLLIAFLSFNEKPSPLRLRKFSIKNISESHSGRKETLQSVNQRSPIPMRIIIDKDLRR